MTRQNMIIRGTRPGGGGSRAPEVPADWPDFYYSSRRPCAPINGRSELWTSPEATHLDRAAQICRDHCPFIAECLAQGVGLGETNYVWGGFVMSRAEQRRQALLAQAEADMRAARRQAVPA